MDRMPVFTEAALEGLEDADDTPPDSESVVETLENLRMELESILGESDWFQRYLWNGTFTTPYIGPGNPTQSSYVWLGLIDEHFQGLKRASHALQLEFGVNGGSARGFFGQDVIWGIILGPWSPDHVTQTIAGHLREHSHVFAQFLADAPGYVLVTPETVYKEPDAGQIEAISEEIDEGFALTRDLRLADLPGIDLFDLTCDTMSRVVPLYRLLANIDDAAPIRLSPGDVPKHSARADDPEHPRELQDIETLAAATTLDAGDIRDTIDRLEAEDCSREEAIRYVQRYLREMLRGDGLFAVAGVGPSSGRSLVRAGVNSVNGLISADVDVLLEETSLSRERIIHLQQAARNGDFRSLDPDDESIADRLTGSDGIQPFSSNPGSGPDGTIQGESDSFEADHQSAKKEVPPGGQEKRPISESGTDTLGTEALSPDELTLPDLDSAVNVDGERIIPNHLSEYYESFRNARKVLEFVFQLGGVDIDPEDRTDPRVQYYILLDACIGFTDLSMTFSGYGGQHQDRLPFSIDAYRRAFGDETTITDYQAINTEPFSTETHQLLHRKTPASPSSTFVRPCVPGTELPLPELPGTHEELQAAMKLLGTFPAYPPLPIENGNSDRTLPLVDIYRTHFEDLDSENRVNLEPLTSGSSPAPSGPVTDATPTSIAEAESTLLDYGRLTHLYRRLSPPPDSPVKRALGVFALEWYRKTTPNFEALQALAKHGEEWPVETFRPRLQDLVHRRFLLDDWDYDLITVYPGHQVGSLSPELVDLAQDAVLETEIVYTPMLERTKTVKRQREKSEAERVEVAESPADSLRVRTKLTGETVILLDDICTTGSSLMAGAYLLRQAGAGRVVGLTLGLTPGGPREDVVEVTEPDAVASNIIAGLDC